MLPLAVAHRQPATSNHPAFRGEKQVPLAGAGSSNSLRNSELPSNESSAGLRVPGFEGKGMILHCKMILAELVVRLDSKKG